MNVLIDTNVILDYLLKREPYAADALRIMALCEHRQIYGYVSASSVTDIYYVYQKATRNTEQSKQSIRIILDMLNVAAVDGDTLMEALGLDWKDFEDSVQYTVGIGISADCIITQNVKDYSDSDIEVMTPSEFLDSLWQ